MLTDKCGRTGAWFMGRRLEGLLCFQLLLFSDGAQCEDRLIKKAKRLMDFSRQDRTFASQLMSPLR